MKLKITSQMASEFMAARGLSAHGRRAERKRLMAQIRQQHKPIIGRTRIRLAVENELNPNYLLIRAKHTGVAFDDGKPEPVVMPTPVVAKVVAKPAGKKSDWPHLPADSAAKKPAKKRPDHPIAKVAVAKVAKKIAAKASPASKKAAAKVATKAAISKASLGSIKAPAKALKPAVKVSVAKAPAKAVVAYPREIRAMIGTKRVRLGTAKDAAHEKRLIANAKQAA